MTWGQKNPINKETHTHTHTFFTGSSREDRDCPEIFLRFPGILFMCFPFSPRRRQHINTFDPHPFPGQSRKVVYVCWVFCPLDDAHPWLGTPFRSSQVSVNSRNFGPSFKVMDVGAFVTWMRICWSSENFCEFACGWAWPFYIAEWQGFVRSGQDLYS